MLCVLQETSAAILPVYVDQHYTIRSIIFCLSLSHLHTVADLPYLLIIINVRSEKANTHADTRAVYSAKTHNIHR